MIDRLSLIKSIKKLRSCSDKIVFFIPSSFNIEDIASSLRIIKKFNFRTVSIEITYDKIRLLKELKKTTVKHFILRLDPQLLPLLQNRGERFETNGKKITRLHLRIQDWQHLDLLKNLYEISATFNCKNIIIGIENKDDIESPYVFNSIPLIYKYLSDAKLCITLENINAKFLQTHLPLEIDTLYIEPNNTCNFSCPFCGTGQKRIKPIPHLDFVRFKNIMDQFPAISRRIFLFGRGEPFLNQDIFGMIKYLKNRGCKNVITSTNGYFLNKKNIYKILNCKLDKIIIALDSVNRHSYNRLRIGSNFDLVTQNIKLLSKIRSKLLLNLDVALQFIITKHNENEIDTMVRFSKDLGFKSEFRAAETTKQDLIPLNHRFRRHNKEIDAKSRVMRFCLRPWNRMYIFCDGFVSLCGKIGSRIKMGNVIQQELEKVWNGDKYLTIRKQMLIDKSKLRFCSNNRCPYSLNLTSKVIEEKLNVREEHVYALLNN